ncbi:MAG: hypothetical protein H5U20_08820 [Rhodobacteraceae bacterium]|nr:hypothetical protein [Paracoccaceae bacterium]
MVMCPFPGRLGRFLRDDDRGTVGAESIIMLPLLLWAFLAMFVYWDAFRTQNASEKAAYVIGDMISRESNPITSAYVDGMGDLFDYLTQERFPTSVRISSIAWDAVTEDYAVIWSDTSDGSPVLTTDIVEQWDAILPIIPAGDTVILVETVLDYEPVFAVGLSARQLRQFIYTRPRFVTAIGHADVPGSATGIPGEVPVAG